MLLESQSTETVVLTLLQGTACFRRPSQPSANNNTGPPLDPSWTRVWHRREILQWTNTDDVYFISRSYY